MSTPHRSSDRILIRGGRVIDPVSGFDQTSDVLVGDGILLQIGRVPDREAIGSGGRVSIIDAEGCIVCPGLIDPHVHLREPGFEYKETIASGAASAVNGGFTAVCCMPNTDPPLDSAAQISLVERQAARAGMARVHAVAAATVGRKGERAGALNTLARAGAVGFSDDGEVVHDAGVMREVLIRVRETGLAFMQHCQEPSLTRGGVMNAGALATRLGLGGWPAIAEEVIIERDIEFNRGIGCRYHVQHVSSAGSVELVRQARRRGAPITCEAAPHHLLLTEHACTNYNTNAKMNPPLRTQADVDALLAGVADGTITVLATDHAPHSVDEKSRDFTTAPFGTIGLDCALPLYVRALIEPGILNWPAMLAMLTIEPARLVGLDRLGLGSLAVGGPADITLIDPAVEWTIRASEFASLSRNCPFEGWDVRGRSIAAIVRGVVHGDRLGDRTTGDSPASRQVVHSR